MGEIVRPGQFSGRHVTRSGIAPLIGAINGLHNRMGMIDCKLNALADALGLVEKQTHHKDADTGKIVGVTFEYITKARAEEEQATMKTPDAPADYPEDIGV
jgi:hypothetical protein